jgi:hypothetical protein
MRVYKLSGNERVREKRRAFQDMLRGSILFKGFAGKASKEKKVVSLRNNLPWFYKVFQAGKV